MAVAKARQTGAAGPFRGFKQPGVGRRMGVAGLEEFLGHNTFAVPQVPIAPAEGSHA